MYVLKGLCFKLHQFDMGFVERRQHFGILAGRSRMKWTLTSMFIATQRLDMTTSLSGPLVGLVLYSAANAELKCELWGITDRLLLLMDV